MTLKSIIESDNAKAKQETETQYLKVGKNCFYIRLVDDLKGYYDHYSKLYKPAYCC